MASFYTKNSTPDQHSSEQSSLKRSLKHTQTLASQSSGVIRSVSQPASQPASHSVSRSASQSVPLTPPLACPLSDWSTRKLNHSRSSTHSSVSQSTSVSQPVGPSVSRSGSVVQSVGHPLCMSLCRVCRLCHALSRRVTHTTSHSDTLYCLSLCHSILSVTLPLCDSVAQTVCRSVCPLTLSLVGLSLTLPGGLSPIYYLSVCHSYANSYAIYCFATHVLSLVLYYQSLCHAYYVSLCHSDTLLALKPSSQRTVSRYSLSTSHAVLSSLILLPHAVLPSHSTFIRSI
jgi:hypothetical protein